MPCGRGDRLRLIVKRVALAVVVVLVSLVAIGFIAALLMDGLGWLPSDYAIRLFHTLPQPLRIVLEVLVGIPIIVGAMLYFVIEVLDLGWFASRPFVWVYRRFTHSER